MRYVTPLLALAMAAGCARPFAPPGGERDVLPPALVSVTPEPLSVVAPSREPVVIRFSERISQRRFNRTLVTVTPAQPEDVNARVSGHELRISLEGGWQPDRVYQVLVRPGIVDLFGNERRDPVEVIFSTGAPPPPSALAGVLEERITGRPPRDGVIVATRQSDSTTYFANADSAGFYALRHVPYGIYDVTAYADQNRNRRHDGSEPAAGPVVATLAAGQDTVLLDLLLLPSDTTPPRLTGAERIDSLYVRASFDDYIDPDADFGGIGVQVLSLPDSASLGYTARVLTTAAYERQRQERAAAADTAAPPAAARPPAAADPPVPERSIILEFARALPPAELALVVTGVTNVNGLPGGGTATVAYRAPPTSPEPEPDAPPTPQPDARPDRQRPRRPDAARPDPP
ncbi:MAG TPA: Ig-like domain-containing protein [Longimicrobiales bacterium]|nr:Ig-like domain-containing protein [Longimicrobiales bacterium]